MDMRTGLIHEIKQGETLEALAAQLGGKRKDFTPVARKADGVCLKCKGTGAIRRGLFSKRFKPCECVL